MNAAPPVLVARQTEWPEIRHAQRRDASIVRVSANGGLHDLPDLRGLSAREALRVLTKMGLTARLTGNGAVTRQTPPPGTPIEPGMTCELRLERTPMIDGALAGEP